MMKIRSDFVTNSSSVSYILTMCEDMVETYMKSMGIAERNPETARLINAIRDDLRRNGTCVFLEGKEIVTKQVKFDTGETLTEDIRETPILKMEDDELWSYIFGEYVLNCQLSTIWGFGATQIDTY